MKNINSTATKLIKGEIALNKTSLKKLISFVVAFMMVFSLFVPSGFSMAKAAEGQKKITILATSDLHGRIYPHEYATDTPAAEAGLAKVATIVKKVKSENPNTILVDNGDSIQDNMINLFNNDEVHPMIAAMNEIGYDAWELGNHEFNYGLDVLNRAIKNSKATVLAGNIYKEDGTRYVNAYKIVEKGGVKVALIGMITPHVPRWEASTPDHFKGLTFKDPLEETKKVVNELKGKVDVMIGVMHMGEDGEYDVESSGVKAIANAVPELTAIVAGHAHSDIKGDVVNGVLIVEPKAFGARVSKIDLTLVKVNGKWTVKDKVSENISTKEVQPDQNILDKFKYVHEKSLADANTVIGQVGSDFLTEVKQYGEIPTAQIQDTALVDFINEVQMYYTGADISAAALFDTNSNLKAGPFKKKDVVNIYKYDNTLIALKVTGKQLKQYMEWSAKYYNQYKPGDVTISFNPNIRAYNYDMFAGVNYDIDISQPAGQRIKNLTFKGKPVTDDMTFTLAVNNYRFGNMVTDKIFNAADKIYDSAEKNLAVRDLIVDYVKKKGTIYPTCDNNWKIIGADLENPLKSKVVSMLKSGTLTIPKSADGRTPNVESLNVYKLIAQGVLDGKDLVNKVEILSINDLHGSLKKEGKNPGIANLVGEIKKAKEANRGTVFVGAGDLFQGSAESNLLYGKPVAEALKQAGMLVSAIGNHEYDWGLDKLPSFANNGNFYFVAANIYNKRTGQPVQYAKPYYITDVAGKKVAFIGLATPETSFKTKPTNVADVEFKNPADVLPQYIKEVKEKGADLVIALTHLGAFQDANTKAITGEVADITKIPGLDGVITGHTHQSVAGKLDNIPVVQGYYNGRTIAKLVFLYDKQTGKLIDSYPVLDEIYKRIDKLTEDPATKAIYDKYAEQVKPVLSEKIGETTVNIDHNKDTKAPTLMGEWVADIMRKTVKADIAIQNGGGLRTSIEKGDITVGKMYELMPFDNTLVVAKLTGAQIKAQIENGIANEKISFGQVAGVYVTYDLSRPFGDRVVKITLENGQPLDMNKVYTVVANDFMFDGGDGYIKLKDNEKKDTGIPVREAIIEYIKAQKVVSPVYKGYQKEVNAASSKSAAQPQVKPAA
jgi:2',3'-cyclic-nucleotide 2'-phosphodiesterase/3'-nucleotidase/5'-nucleotidase